VEGSPLDRLAAESGRSFPTLLKARERTRAGLADRRERLAKLDHDGDVSVVLMGSWGRAEVTSGSDDDFMLLVHGHERAETDRIASAFVKHGAADAGGRALGAYDAVLALIDDDARRMELEGTTRGTARQSAAFLEISRLGDEIQQGLLALLFETATLPRLVREYGIF
jgi:hypothetical protein